MHARGVSRTRPAGAGSAAASQDRPRPRRRRRAGNRPHRSDPGARRNEHPDRLHRGHEHGLDRRRPLLLRLHARRDGGGDQVDQVGDALPGRARPAGTVLPAEGGRLRAPDPARVRPELQEGRPRPAARPHRRKQARVRARHHDASVLGRELRRASHPLPGGRDGHPDRRALRDVEGQPGAIDSSEHGHSGDLHARRNRRPSPDRWRRVPEPPGADGPGHGRRHRDRGQRRRIGSRDGGQAHERGRHDRPADRSAAPAEHDGVGEARRHRDHARPQGLYLGGFRGRHRR